MTKYRVYVKISEQNRFWVVAEDGRLIKKMINITRENIIETKSISYNDTNICPECRKENNITDKSILFPQNARRKTDEKGNKTEEWLCRRHGYNSYSRNDPISHHNMIKLLTGRRTGNLTDPKTIFSDKCQKVSCIWFGVKDLNKELDNYTTPIDHSPIPKGVFIEIGGKLVDLSGKIPQTKGINFKTYIGKEGGWEVTCLERERNKKFDITIVYCISEDRKTIERIYIFHKEAMLNKTIAIVKNPKYGNQWYNSYMVTDKKELDNVNKIWLDEKN